MRPSVHLTAAVFSGRKCDLSGFDMSASENPINVSTQGDGATLSDIQVWNLQDWGWGPGLWFLPKVNGNLRSLWLFPHGSLSIICLLQMAAGLLMSLEAVYLRENWENNLKLYLYICVCLLFSRILYKFEPCPHFLPRKPSYTCNSEW